MKKILLLALPLALASAETRLASLEFPDMAGWVRRTHNKGVVDAAAERDGVPAHVAVGPDAPGDDSILQRDIALAGTGAARVVIRARWRLEDVAGGEQPYQRAGIQARFTKAGQEMGGWVAVAAGAGTTEWADAEVEADVPEGADGLFARVYAYGCRSGRMRVSRLEVDGVTADELAARRLRFRPAEEYGGPVPAPRLAKMSRGVNINNWFCQPWNEALDGQKGGFNAEWYDRFVTDADLQQLAASGALHIRLPVDPEPFMDMGTGALNMEAVPLLAKALGRARAAGLAVEFNPHAKMPALKAMRGTRGLAEKFIRWSGEMAAWIGANTDPEWVFVDILNEPGSCGYYLNDWIPLQDQLVAAWRAAAPRHTLILNTGGWMLPWELQNFPAHPDRNTVYAVHYYYPSQFSHQGAVWMSAWYHPLRRVPWPFGEAELPGIIARLDRADAGRAAHAEKAMTQAVAEGVGKPENIDAHFRGLAAWSAQNKRGVVVNEFGVHKVHADEDSRARWLRHIRESCEKNNFGWTHWEYQHSMGFASGKPGERVFEEQTARALGFAP